MTVHWIHTDTFARNSSSLACRRFKGTHAFNKIRELIIEIHKKYDLRLSKITKTVTDYGSNRPLSNSLEFILQLYISLLLSDILQVQENINESLRKLELSDLKEIEIQFLIDYVKTSKPVAEAIRSSEEVEDLPVNFQATVEDTTSTPQPFFLGEVETKWYKSPPRNNVITDLTWKCAWSYTITKYYCGGQVQINDHNIQHAESTVQDEINDQQSGHQDLDGGPQPAGASKRKNQPLVISDDEDEAMSNTTPSNVRPTPAQDDMKKKIAKLHAELDLTERRKRSLVADGTEFDKACNLRREIDICEKKLKSKEKQRVYSMMHRKNQKQKLIELCSKNPDAAKSLTPRDGPGRPRLEKEQSELLKTISDLALFGASAEERRRCEIVRTVHTLSEFTNKLSELGFNISRSATYIRLLPRRANT
ncbi:hypothetical protein KGM_205865 [Danaus plexippus plexippus]|uniref:Uncharacterized protein n=1 Tax=Danaus plexippus plexippus TaxID=278856 RepID=A0A212F3P3_DANPL|nr:hypothetical protein KGM_205865 [Danaus plexippus plexippus]